MADRTEQIQVLYEVSLTIGGSLDLRKMLRTTLSAFLRRLNLSAGGVYTFSEGPPGTFFPASLYTIPRDVSHNSAVQSALISMGNAFNQAELDSFRGRLPHVGRCHSGEYFYIFDLPGVGVLLVIKSGEVLDDMVAMSLKSLARKLAEAISACMEHDLLQASLESLESTKEALGKSEARIRAIVETAVDGIITINESGIIQSFNPAAENIFGYQFSEVQGRPVNMLMPEPHRTHHQSYIERYLTTGRSNIIGTGREVTGRRKDGSSVPLDFSLAELHIGSEHRFTAILRDISARKQTEKDLQTAHDQLTLFASDLNKTINELKASEKRYKDLFNSISDLIITHDLDGRLLSINPAVSKLLGYQSAEMIGRSIMEFIVPKYRNVFEENYLKEIIAKGYTEGIASFQGKDGTEYYIEYRNVLVKKGEGESYASASGRDITERMKTQILLDRIRRREVDIGSRIQKELLMGELPVNLDGAETAALTVPSQRIDGDFYDFVQHSDTCFDVIIGDVMGKGIAAALLGAAAKSLFQRAFGKLIYGTVTGALPQLADIISWVGGQMVKKLILLESFITLCYARIDLEKAQVQFVDCGHTRTMLYHNGRKEVELLHGDNMPLGFSESDHYIESTEHLDPGDTLFFYSDGITEAASPSGEMFGEGRLLELVRNHGSADPGDLIKAIYAEIKDFSKSETFSDDLTCVAVKFKKPAETIPLVRSVFEILSQLDQLVVLRRFFNQFMASVPPPAVDEETASLLELALNEAATNIMKHAYQGEPGHAIEFAAEAYPTRLVFRLCHSGRTFDPTKVAAPDFDGSRSGGFGLYIIERSVDELEHIVDSAGRNCIVMTKLRK